MYSKTNASINQYTTTTKNAKNINTIKNVLSPNPIIYPYKRKTSSNVEVRSIDIKKQNFPCPGSSGETPRRENKKPQKFSIRTRYMVSNPERSFDAGETLDSISIKDSIITLLPLLLLHSHRILLQRNTLFSEEYISSCVFVSEVDGHKNSQEEGHGDQAQENGMSSNESVGWH